MIAKKAYLHFTAEQTANPYIYELVRDYDLVVNVFRARVTPGKDGYLSLEMRGTTENLDRGIAYLRDCGVEIHSGDVGLIWKADACTHCTNCTVHCPTGALHIADRRERRVTLEESLCIECLACITHCPFRVCSSIY